MRLIWIILALSMGAAAVAPILAQGIPPTDQEIATAYALCNRPENFVGFGAVGNRPPGAGGYKPEWKRCEAIDAEHAKRDLAKKQKEKDDQSHIDFLLNRLPK